MWVLEGRALSAGGFKEGYTHQSLHFDLALSGCACPIKHMVQFVALNSCVDLQPAGHILHLFWTISP